jgi:hypothetical protein
MGKKSLQIESAYGGEAPAPASSTLMMWLLVGYMWLFIHQPFIYIWRYTGVFPVERAYMIFAIGCWVILGPALPSGNRLHRYSALFVMVMLLSWFLSPYHDVGTVTVENYLKYAVFYVILVTSVRDERGLRTILAGYLGVMTVFMAHSVRESFLGRGVYAQGLTRLVAVGGTYDFNDFAGLIVCSLPFVWALWRHCTAPWQRALLLGYLALAGYCVVKTGSRMGFVGVVLAGALACLISAKRWRLLALYPVILAAAWMVLPERQKDRYSTLVDPDYISIYGASSIGTYRYSGFEKGLIFCKERPLLGFGPMGYLAMEGMMPHNLYGQLIAELGIAGAIAFGLILWGIAQNTLEARRLIRGTGNRTDTLPYRAVVAMSGTYLLLVVMGWGFNFLFWHVWLWFGGFQVCALRCLKAGHDAPLSLDLSADEIPISDARTA